MRLTNKNIASYLCDRGFLDIEDLINGNFVLTQSQSRNSFFHIDNGKKTGIFVKQLLSMDSQNAYLMQKDATAYYLIHNSGIYKDASKHIPQYLGYDSKNHVLVTEYFPNAKNLYEWSIANKKISINQAVMMADILGAFHHDIGKDIQENTSLQFFNRELPWILNLPITPLVQSDAIYYMIQQDSFLCQQLDDLRLQWKGESLVHGDVKLVNFIAINEGEEELIKLVDWEIVNIGDPLWDVAGLIQSYLFAWVTSLTPTPEGYKVIEGQGFWEGKERNKVLLAFWQRYTKKQGWNKNMEQEAMLKTVKYVGARLLQSARELNQFTQNQLIPNASLLVQLAKNTFQSPETTAKELLGIKK